MTLKLTENGDFSFTSPSTNKLIDILFLTEYYQKYLNEVPKLGTSFIEQLFAMFIRDPRFGLGRRDLGRKLLQDTQCDPEFILFSGRTDDLWHIFNPKDIAPFLKEKILAGDALIKKWMPRYSSKNLLIAREFAKLFNLNKQQYGKFIKVTTTESNLSQKHYDDILFEHVPALAMLKYAHCFATDKHLSNRYQQYLLDVANNKKDLKVSTTTVYDIYRNRYKIDADLFFSKIEKISGSWIPIIDSSGSMVDKNDSYGKAMAIGHYLAKCSSYCPDKVISFSSHPQLITLGQEPISTHYNPFGKSASQYEKELRSMHTGDYSNTDFGAVMNLLSSLSGDMPEYLIVLSDMELDSGSYLSKERTMQLFKEKGYKTKILWWNLNSRNTTAPETDEWGNIFFSGYNPLLLKFLKVGFDSHKFLRTLLEEYYKILVK